MKTKEEERERKRKYMAKCRKEHPEKIKKWYKYPYSYYLDKRRFGGLKEEVLKRDNYTCQDCGMTNEEHIKKWKRKITVHHKDGNGRYAKNKNHAMSNMVTLCLSCHSRIDTWERYNL